MRLVLCCVCQLRFPADGCVPASAVAFAAVDVIKTWDRNGFICLRDVDMLRLKQFQSIIDLMAAQRAPAGRSIIDDSVSWRMQKEQLERRAPTFGERMADYVAKFGGSWMFIILFTAFICTWMGVNTMQASVASGQAAWDPYPFVFLNLCLSCLAAVQAPVSATPLGQNKRRRLF